MYLIRQIAASVTLPTTGSADEIQQMIEGRLSDLGTDLMHVQVFNSPLKLRVLTYSCKMLMVSSWMLHQRKMRIVEKLTQKLVNRAKKKRLLSCNPRSSESQQDTAG